MTCHLVIMWRSRSLNHRRIHTTHHRLRRRRLQQLHFIPPPPPSSLTSMRPHPIRRARPPLQRHTSPPVQVNFIELQKSLVVAKVCPKGTLELESLTLLQKRRSLRDGGVSAKCRNIFSSARENVPLLRKARVSRVR